MAVLSKNGSEIGRIAGFVNLYSYRSNGWVLVNRGDGWKRAAQLEDVHKGYAEDLRYDRGRYALHKEYQDFFHSVFPHKQRAAAAHYLTLLPDDPDGFYIDITELHGAQIEMFEAVELYERRKVWQLFRDQSPWGLCSRFEEGSLIERVFKNRKSARVVLHDLRKKEKYKIRCLHPIELQEFLARGNWIED